MKLFQRLLKSAFGLILWFGVAAVALVIYYAYAAYIDFKAYHGEPHFSTNDYIELLINNPDIHPPTVQSFF